MGQGMAYKQNILKSREELIKNFKLHYNSFKLAMRNFDERHISEAHTLANQINTFVYDHGKNKPSLLTLIDKKNILFKDSVGPIIEGNLIPDFPLVSMHFGGPSGFEYVALLDNKPTRHPDVPFTIWWNRMIFKNPQSDISFSRKDLIQGMRNMMGGSHVSEKWNEIFAFLQRENPTGMVLTKNGKQSKAEIGPEYVMVRQIAYEVEATLNKNCLDIFMS